MTKVPKVPRVAVLTAVSGSGEKGGAERFYAGLVDGFSQIGCDATEIPIEADESSYQQIISNYKRVMELDLSDYDVVISTKAPTFVVNHPRHVMYLVHTIRVFDDNFDENFPNPSLEQSNQRANIHHLDKVGMGNAIAKFTIGQEVSNRLYKWRGIDSRVIHPAVVIDGLYNAEPKDYIFIPGRLHKLKRVHLLIEAVKNSEKPIKLKIAGTGEEEDKLKELAAGDARIEFLGRVSDSDLKRLYAECLAVAFVPVREDFGYITIEAFESGKPVLTCSDSGEPTQFVKNGINGWVCKPEPLEICKTMESIFDEKQETIRKGAIARESLHLQSWSEIAEELLISAYNPEEASSIKDTSIEVVVVDMQPITPAIGGGRQRLLGLYHDLGNEGQICCNYVGSYDWPGEKFRVNQVSTSLTETTVPLSDSHHRAASDLKEKCGGKVVIDLAFSTQATLSTDYLDEVKRKIAKADVVVFSHPWVFPLVKNVLRPEQLVVYDSQNVEGYLRAQLLDSSNPPEMQLLRQVVGDELEVATRAELVLCCSHEDMMRFSRIYDLPVSKMRVVPNGIMAINGAELCVPGNQRIREKLGIPKSGGVVTIFIGSPYGPNVDAARFIVNDLANSRPQDVFVIAGGVSNIIDSHPRNVVLTGEIEDEKKSLWFQASDIALNPMMSGSGTNIKMFDFMAHGLPVISTLIGARGIQGNPKSGIIISTPTVEDFSSCIDSLYDSDFRASLGENARRVAQSDFSWERITRFTGALLSRTKEFIGQSRPLFTVVIPTYERHEQLGQLMQCLSEQIERDFEVVIVDQSAEPWKQHTDCFGFPIYYYHTPVKGAVRARNTGAALANGEVIAFTDDDCRPEPEWLLNARAYFADQSIVGIEGCISSNHHHDPDWRPVTNVGFEGIGYMTANLFVKTTAFLTIGGFDLQFDDPHFREDTDFGWRLLELGHVPYANDVKVFHPAQKRDNERESHEARGRMFQNDALLYSKHPEKFKQLYMMESQLKNGTPGFRENLLLGFEKHGIRKPDWMDL